MKNKRKVPSQLAVDTHMQRSAINRLRSQPAKKASFVEPMECLSVPRLSEGSQWLWEIKRDGYRALAVKSGSDVTLFSRRRDPEEARDHEPDPGRRDAPARLSSAQPCRRIRFPRYDGQGTGFIGGGTKQTDLLAPCKATGPCLAQILALERPLLRAEPDSNCKPRCIVRRPRSSHEGNRSH